VNGIVDWSLGERIAGAVASDPGGAAPDAAHIRAVCDEGLDRVLAYTGLTPVSEVPPGEAIGRKEWIRANLEMMRELAQPLEERAGEFELPWPIGGLARRGLGVAAGAEVGVMLGYAGRRVLGQYHVSLAAEPKPPRMLLVVPNLKAVATELRAVYDPFLLWVTIHEQTHSVQFAAVPWLRDHVAGIVSRIIDSASESVDIGALVGAARKVISTDPRESVRRALRGELTRALAGPEQRAALDEVQAAMAVIEGYAEHVMDAAVAGDPVLEAMRGRMDARRAQRGGLVDMIMRVLGMGQKMRQYELGKAFCDGVAAEGGIDALNGVWQSPGALPKLAELEDPQAWLRRRSDLRTHA
jgi:coenzyme F420 biosynthesis associated uncharacterized protein